MICPQAKYSTSGFLCKSNVPVRLSSADCVRLFVDIQLNWTRKLTVLSTPPLLARLCSFHTSCLLESQLGVKNHMSQWQKDSASVCVSAGADSWPNTLFRTEGGLLTPVRAAGFETHTPTHTYICKQTEITHPRRHKLAVLDVLLVVNGHWFKKVPCGTRKRKLTSLSGCLRPDSRITVWLHGKSLAEEMGEKGGGGL